MKLWIYEWRMDRGLLAPPSPFIDSVSFIEATVNWAKKLCLFYVGRIPYYFSSGDTRQNRTF